VLFVCQLLYARDFAGNLKGGDHRHSDSRVRHEVSSNYMADISEPHDQEYASHPWRPLGSERWNQSLSPIEKDTPKPPGAAEEAGQTYWRNFLQTPSSIAQLSPEALDETAQSEAVVASNGALGTVESRQEGDTAADLVHGANSVAASSARRSNAPYPRKSAENIGEESIENGVSSELSRTCSTLEDNASGSREKALEGLGSPHTRRTGTRGDFAPSMRTLLDAGVERTPRPSSPPTPPSPTTPHLAMRHMQQEIERLKKQNFNLKLRIYFLEEALAAAGIDYRAIDGTGPTGARKLNDDSTVSQCGAIDFDFDSIRLELEAKEERLRSLQAELEERLADLEERDELLQTAREAIMGLQEALQDAQARIQRAEEQALEAAKKSSASGEALPSPPPQAGDCQTPTPVNLDAAIREALASTEAAFREEIQRLEEQIRIRDEQIRDLEQEICSVRDSKDEEIRGLQEELQAAIHEREKGIDVGHVPADASHVVEREQISALESHLVEAEKRIEQLSLEAKHYQSLLKESDEQRTMLQRALEKATTHAAREPAVQIELQERLTAAQKERDALASALEAVRTEQATSNERVAAAEDACRHAEQRCRELESTLTRTTSDAMERVRRLVEAHEKEREHWQLTEEQLRHRESAEREELHHAQKTLKETQEKLAAECRSHAQLSLEHAQALGHIEHLQARLEAGDSELDALQARLKSIELESQRQQEELELCQSERDELAEKLHEAIRRIATLERELQAKAPAGEHSTAATEANVKKPETGNYLSHSSGYETLKAASAPPSTEANERNTTRAAESHAAAVQAEREPQDQHVERLRAEFMHYQSRCRSLEEMIADRDRHIHQLCMELSQSITREQQLQDQIREVTMRTANARPPLSAPAATATPSAENGAGGRKAADGAPASTDLLHWDAIHRDIRTLHEDIRFWREEVRHFCEQLVSLQRFQGPRPEASVPPPTSTPEPHLEKKAPPALGETPPKPAQNSWERTLHGLEQRIERVMRTVDRLAQVRGRDAASEPGSPCAPEATQAVPDEVPQPAPPSRSQAVAAKPPAAAQASRQKTETRRQPKHHDHDASAWPGKELDTDEPSITLDQVPDDLQVSREMIHFMRTRHHRRRVEAPEPAVQPVSAPKQNDAIAPTQNKLSKQAWQDAILRQVEETQRVIAATQKRLERERAAFLRRTHTQSAARTTDDLFSA